jgi:hypothetical protein
VSPTAKQLRRQAKKERSRGSKQLRATVRAAAHAAELWRSDQMTAGMMPAPRRPDQDQHFHVTVRCDGCGVDQQNRIGPCSLCAGTSGVYAKKNLPVQTAEGTISL